MNRVLLADVLPQPWRNGHGLTRELLAWPDAADWLLRVSVAEVAADCVFSAFPGVTRCFAVVGGHGVWLSLPGGAVQAMAQGVPVCFDGALAPACRLVDGPTQDLNLMAQTHAGSGHVRRATVARGLAGSSGGSSGWRALYAAQAVLLDVDGMLHAVPAGALLWSNQPGPSSWRLLPGTSPLAPQAWWLAWDAR